MPPALRALRPRQQSGHASSHRSNCAPVQRARTSPTLPPLPLCCPAPRPQPLNRSIMALTKPAAAAAMLLALVIAAAPACAVIPDGACIIGGSPCPRPRAHFEHMLGASCLHARAARSTRRRAASSRPSLRPLSCATPLPLPPSPPAEARATSTLGLRPTCGLEHHPNPPRPLLSTHSQRSPSRAAWACWGLSTMA